MKNIGIILVGIAIIGLVVLALCLNMGWLSLPQAQTTPPAPPVTTTQPEEIQALRTELAKVRAAVLPLEEARRQLTEENARQKETIQKYEAQVKFLLAMQSLSGTAKDGASASSAPAPAEDAAKTPQLPAQIEELIIKLQGMQIKNDVSILAKKLALTPEQATQLEELLKQELKDQIGLVRQMADEEIAKDQGIAQLKKLRQEIEAGIKNALTPDQYTAYTKYQEDKQEKQSAATVGFLMGQITDRVDELSPEQKTKLKELIKSDIKGQIAGAAPSESIFTPTAYEQMKSALTPQQAEQFDTFIKEMQQQREMSIQLLKTKKPPQTEEKK